MSPEAAPLEIWGGHECSLNRVGAVCRDQTVLTGHHERIEDLDDFAALGLKALRYPLLWERIETAPGVFDWNWTDARLERMQALGLRPVAGLVHHGSGPAWTDLLNPDFAPGLARFAGEAARRYPWIRDWTPVNEPLTTARFAALYGLWHPHLSNEHAFWSALLNQIDAVRMAMRAIRHSIPDARLIQTEDFGHAFATAPCQEQADHENQRRLMTWDLLCGRVVADHPLHDRLQAMGFGARLGAIAADPCPPVIGLNHYLTSDRFLDHRVERYPAALHGGNGRIAYADVEAVRAIEPPPPGWGWHISCLWARYGLPIVVTECHLGCTREEQLRWLAECWNAAVSARALGVQVEAVTVWSLLGAYDWNSLLTRPDGVYESGVFDLADGHPRATALASLVKEIAVDGATGMALAQEAGWWRRPQRLLYPPHLCPAPAPAPSSKPHGHVVLCAPDEITPDLQAECEQRGLGLVSATPDRIDAHWTYAASAAPTARAMDLLIDRWLGEGAAGVPCTGHRDTGGLQRA